MISPGYPAEMPFFTRGLGAGRAPGSSASATSRRTRCPADGPRALAHYVHTGSLADEDAVIGPVRELARHVRIDQVECLWEPYMMLAARLARGAGPARA